MIHSEEPTLQTRAAGPSDPPRRTKLPRWVFRAAVSAVLLVLILAGGFFYARHWVRSTVHSSLPQLDGQLAIPGLAAPVTVGRDAHGVPHIHAASIDDLLIAQGYIAASDRLFQMDTLRRHAAGELAEILGPSLIPHDRLQRTLQIRASADRALSQLPPAQLHMLEKFAAGVNASMAAQADHLPIEFRVLRYTPAPWTPRDSLLVLLAMFQDLTNTFPAKLARESLVSRLPPATRAQLEQDLYPTTSWRDHPPAADITDLTIEGQPIPDVPLDESQSKLGQPTTLGAPFIAPLFNAMSGWATDPCLECKAGSNNWVVSGAHTASGKPLLSNDMHLSLSLPGIWYSAVLEAGDFYAAGVTLPGVPLVVVGHNRHIAWGFTNLGADVQDLYLETLRGTGKAQEFQASDSSWQPVVHLPEPIRVKGGKTVAFEVLATRHGAAVTPILNPILTGDAINSRTISLRWTLYDPANIQIPTLAVDSARDWPSLLAAFSDWGGPAQNVVYADDRGHIGYHTVGKIPLRGGVEPAHPNIPADIAAPSVSTLNQTGLPADALPPIKQLSGPLSPVPLAPGPAHEWSGYIPFDQLPQVFDPAGGVIATANGRIAPDDYPYPITLDWSASYRTERIYHLLAHSRGLTPASMLNIQTDVTSDFDRVLAQRLAYSLDHSLANSTVKRSPDQVKRLHQAADLLRTFDGRMSTDSAAASIVGTTGSLLWPMLLQPQLQNAKPTEDFTALYSWGERNYALEQILMHTPARWLPANYANWNDFLTAAVQRALTETKAPADLSKWTYGSIHKVDIEHPIFAQSELLRYLLGKPTGTGPQPQSGDHTTIKQVGPTFGPSERFTADLSNLDNSTLNLVLGQSGNPESPWFLDQFPAWLRGSTFPQSAPATHTLTLVPR